jgi:UDP-N-acetylglucosamine 4,6-dehydratase
MRIVDLAAAVAPNAILEEVGMRPGEKLHEEMISGDDSRRTVLLHDRFVVTPVVAEWGYEAPIGVPMPEGLAYQSNTNDLWMSTDEIKHFLQEMQK